MYKKVITIFYYIKLKSRLSVRPSAFFPRQADNSAASASIDAGLAQNQSYVLWHLKVYF